ncbi:MAG: hypothetical protein HY673_05775 [Chloroflexi bacterium]|nr:hypothetical protein [Chloroflexota bacterium]
MLELVKGIESIFQACSVVRPGERIVIVADNEPEPVWVGQMVVDVVNSMGAEPVLAIMNKPVRGQEPPAAIAAAMKSANAVIILSHALVHTTARKEATAAGVRCHPLSYVSLDSLKKGVSVADIRAIKERTEDLVGRLTRASVARLTTRAGTDLTLGLAGRQALALHPLSPLLGGIPDYAEAAIAPVEGSAEGTIVGDVAVVQWGYLFRAPLRFSVKAGKVVEVCGGSEEAGRFREIFSTRENSSNIAELGIGTSHIIPMPVLGSRKDAGRLGTAHIGVGRNDDIGGTTWSQVHLDVLMANASLELDGKPVLDNGKMLLP